MIHPQLGHSRPVRYRQMDQSIQRSTARGMPVLISVGHVYCFLRNLTRFALRQGMQCDLDQWLSNVAEREVEIEAGDALEDVRQVWFGWDVVQEPGVFRRDESNLRALPGVQ